MSWNKDYVRQKYEHHENGADYILYPCSNAKELWVFWGSMSPDRYDRYSWYWNDENWESEEIAYLFFKNDGCNYFLGTNSKPLLHTHKRILDRILSNYNLSYKNCYMIGGSMGGYAALRYGFWLDARGILVQNPQINLKSAQMHTHFNWERGMKEAGDNFCDLDLFVHRTQESNPHIYLEYALNPADLYAARDFMKEFYRRSNNGVLIANQVPIMEHTFNGLNKEIIKSTIDYFRNIPIINDYV